MNDTPLTDAETYTPGEDCRPVQFVPAEFARGLERDLAKLRGQLAAAEADTRRMDFIESHFDDCRFRYVRGWPTMDNSSPPRWMVWTPLEGTTKRPTLREAADAAMQEKPCAGERE